MVWDGARARQEFAQGAILLPLLLPLHPLHPPPTSGNTATVRENCTPAQYNTIGLIRNHPVPQVIGLAPSELDQLLSIPPFLPREN